MDDPKVVALQQRYTELLHAMQTGVASEQAHGSNDGTPKHLRVGVNSALIQNSALATLLMRKGIITELEFWETQVELWELEVAAYEARLSDMFGGEVRLH